MKYIKPETHGEKDSRSTGQAFHAIDLAGCHASMRLEVSFLEIDPHGHMNRGDGF